MGLKDLTQREHLKLITLEYRIEEEGHFYSEPIVELFARDDDGNRRKIEVEGFYPSFYVTEKEFKENEGDIFRESTIRYVTTRSGVASKKYHTNSALKETEEPPRKTLNGEPLVKIETVIPSHVSDLKESGTFEETWEADVFFTNRFLIDSEIKSGFSIPAGQEIVHYDDIEPSDTSTNIKPRILTIDIEVWSGGTFPDTQHPRKPITAVTVHDSYSDEYEAAVLHPDAVDVGDGHSWDDPDLPQEVTVYHDEASMVADINKWIIDKDPDLLTGWNSSRNDIGSGFDYPYWINRSQRIDEWTIDDISPTDSCFVTERGSPVVGGRELFDMLQAYKKTQIHEKRSYSLEYIASEELDYGKEDVADLDEGWLHEPEEFMEYNIRDVEAVVEIEKAKNVLEMYDHIREIAGATYSEIADSNIGIIDMLYLREAKKRGVALPTSVRPDVQHYWGAYVFPPKAGKHKNVVYPDLKCFTPDHEVVTPDGIKGITELEVGDDVYSINPENGSVEIKPVVEVYEYPEYDEEVVNFEGTRVDLTVTPNHRMLYQEGDDYYFEEARHFKGRKELPNPSKGIDGPGIDVFDITDHISEDLFDVRATYDEHDGDDIIEFLGWFISEGSVYHHKNSNTASVQIVQHKHSKNVENLFDRMDINYSLTDGAYTVGSEIYGKFLDECCGVGSQNMRIPEFVFKDASIHQKEILLDTLMKGDGCGNIYYTSSPKLAEDVVRLASELGKKVKKKVRRGNEYEITITETNDGLVDYMHSKSTAENGVYSVEVADNNTLMIGKNGKYQWTGNSLYPNLFRDMNASPETIIGYEEDLRASEYSEADCHTLYVDPRSESEKRDADEPERKELYVLKPEVKESFVRDVIGDLIDMKYEYQNDQYDDEAYGAVKRITNCHTPDTEVITKNGIKNIRDVEVGELVYSFNPDEDSIEFKPVTNTFAYPEYDQELVSIKNASTDFTVTKDHKFVVNRSRHSDEWEEVKARDLNDWTHYELPHDWDGMFGDGIDTFEIDEYTDVNYRIESEVHGHKLKSELNEELTKISTGGYTFDEYDESIEDYGKITISAGHNHQWIPREYDADNVIQLTAWVITEGSFYDGTSKKVSIAQENEEYRSEISSLLEEMNIPFYNGDRGVSICNTIWYDIMSSWVGVGSESKHLPEWISELNEEQKKLMLETLMKGDGDSSENSYRYTTKSTYLRDDIMKLLVEIGHAPKYRRDSNVWRILTGESGHSFRMHRDGDIEMAEDGVYDVEVADNHTIIAGRNGNFQVTHQSVYGCMGDSVSYGVGFRLFDWRIAEAITLAGRDVIKHTANTFEKQMKRLGYNNADIIAGDSVPAEEPTIVKRNGSVSVIQIQNVEIGDMVWSDSGFTEVKDVIRKPNRKQLYSIRSQTGITHTTSDHGLLRDDGTEVTPEDLSVGEQLMHSDVGKIDLPQTSNISKEEAWLLGNDANKRVPEKILNAPKASKKAFLDGFHEGDDEMWSKSPVMLQGIVLLLRDLDIEISLSWRNNYGNQYYRVRCPNHRKVDETECREIEKYEYTGEYVYDLETDNQHFASGIGSMIVHNTDSAVCKVPSADGSWDTSTMSKNDVQALVDEANVDSVETPLAETVISSIEAARYVDSTYSEFMKNRFGIEDGNMAVEIESYAESALFMDKKKRYAQWVRWDEGDLVDEIEVKGFELVRSDSSAITEEVQYGVLERILKQDKAKDSVKDYLKDHWEDVTGGDVSLDAIGKPSAINSDVWTYGYSKQDDGSYNYYTPQPHIRGARYATAFVDGEDMDAGKPLMFYTNNIDANADIPETYAYENKLKADTEDPKMVESGRRVDAIALEDSSNMPDGITVDWEKMASKTLRDPIEPIVEVLDWSFDDLISEGNQTDLSNFM